MERKTYQLVYQCGLANVINTSGLEPQRVLQGSFRQCEDFSRGLIEAGAWVSVMHCDVAGDMLNSWGFENLRTGPGTMFEDSKNPPRTASFVA